jgi:hypothetical protein
VVAEVETGGDQGAEGLENSSEPVEIGGRTSHVEFRGRDGSEPQ